MNENIKDFFKIVSAVGVGWWVISFFLNYYKVVFNAMTIKIFIQVTMANTGLLFLLGGPGLLIIYFKGRKENDN